MAENDNTKCNVCDEKLKYKNWKYLKCDGECNKLFHKRCVNISSENFKEIQQNKSKNWLCDSCNKKVSDKRGKQNQSFPQNNDEKELVNNIPIQCSFSDKVSACSSGIVNTNNVINDSAKLDMILVILKGMENEIKQLKDTVRYYKVEIEKLQDANISLSNNNRILEEKLEENSINIEQLKQARFINNIEINGIPSIGINDEVLVKKLFDTIGVEYPSKINIFRKKQIRKLPNGLPDPILMEFNNKTTKDEFIREIKRNKPTSEIFSGFGENGLINESNFANRLITKWKIYANDQLTTYYKILHKKSRDLKKEGIIKYVWTRDGRLFIRKNEGDKKKLIRAEKDIISLRND